MKNLYQKFKILFIAMCVMSLFAIVGCSNASETETVEETTTPTVTEAPEVEETAEPEVVEGATINIAALAGPTGMGLSYLMESAENGETVNEYNFTITSTSDDVGAGLINGSLDVAAVPINLAAVLAGKTENITLLAVNTLGVLYILEEGDSIQSIEDLAGKDLQATGQGSTPEYIIDYILEQNGLSESVNIEYLTEHSELTALVSTGNSPLAMMPEPNVSVAMSKNENVRVALNLTEEWEKISDSQLVQGCIVVRTDFLMENIDAIEIFLDEYAQSVDNVNNNHDEAGELIAKFGIVSDAAVAASAIENCNIVCITGQEMADISADMYEVLFAANPASIGGAIPSEDIYYIG